MDRKRNTGLDISCLVGVSPSLNLKPCCLISIVITTMTVRPFFYFLEGLPGIVMLITWFINKLSGFESYLS